MVALFHKHIKFMRCMAINNMGNNRLNKNKEHDKYA